MRDSRVTASLTSRAFLRKVQAALVQLTTPCLLYSISNILVPAFLIFKTLEYTIWISGLPRRSINDAAIALEKWNSVDWISKL